MPMNTRCSVGLRMRGHDADDLAVGGHERPAGVAGIGRSVELDQVGEQALAFRRTVLAPQAGDDARRRRRTDAERKADRDHLIAEREVGWSTAAWRPRDRRAASSPATPRGRVSGCTPITVGIRLECRRRRRPSPASRASTTCRLVRMMPLSTTTTPLADTLLDVSAFSSSGPSARTRTTDFANCLVRFRRRRRQRLGFERMQHGRVDVVLRERVQHRP